MAGSDSASIKVINYLSHILANTGVTLERVPLNEEGNIYFLTDNSLQDDAYVLDVTKNHIKITSNSSGSGLFYAIQSLLQLMPAQIFDQGKKYDLPIEIPAVKITDAPLFSHRGAMMDVGRNFLPKETVFKFLDLMAFYKMNQGNSSRSFNFTLPLTLAQAGRIFKMAASMTLFPLPDSPMTTVFLPSGTCKDTPSMAFTPL